MTQYSTGRLITYLSFQQFFVNLFHKQFCRVHITYDNVTLQKYDMRIDAFLLSIDLYNMSIESGRR